MARNVVVVSCGRLPATAIACGRALITWGAKPVFEGRNSAPLATAGRLTADGNNGALGIVDLLRANPMDELNELITS